MAHAPESRDSKGPSPASDTPVCAMPSPATACGSQPPTRITPTHLSSHHHGFITRRILDLAYVLAVTCLFPLYWVKTMDFRLCAARPGVAERDPWLVQPPSAAWVRSWPCNGSQLSKIAHVAASPAPFLQSLLWPPFPSELHFTTTFLLCILGGLLMVALIPTRHYNLNNPWRLAWATITKLHIKAVPLAVHLLRPSTPWPLAIAQNLHTEPAGTIFLALGLSLPAPVQLVVVLVDVAEVALICAFYGEPWPHEASRTVLLLRQAAAGAAAVCISAVLHGGFAGPRRRPAARPQTKGCDADKFRGALAMSDDDCAKAGGAGCSGGDAASQPPTSAPPSPSERPLTVPEPPPTRTHGAASPQDQAAAGTAVASAAGPVQHSYSAPPSSARVAELLERCRSLLTADAAAGLRASDPRVGPVPGPGPGHTTVRASHPAYTYFSSLSITQMHVKLPDVEPWDLPTGLQERLAAALTDPGEGMVAMDVAVRAGCVELHLHVLRSLEAAAVAAAAGATAAWAGPAEPAATGAGAGAAAGGEWQLAPVPEQQRFASSLLEAVGLPPGYDATVRAQIGGNLLTLTPAAPAGGEGVEGGSGGESAGGVNWAVLGTRRMQEYEVPWVARVEPPAVSPGLLCGAAPGGADGCSSSTGIAGANAETHASATAAAMADGGGAKGGYVTASFRLTVWGQADQLSIAHQDKELELLAMYGSGLLRVSDVRWEPPPAGAEQSPRDPSGMAGLVAAAAPALGQRVLTARIAVPVGCSGSVRLVLVRRGMAGQSAPLLLVRPHEATLAAEVSRLQRRAESAEATVAAMWVGGGGGGDAGGAGPSASSVARFIDDLGRWLQYRDYWLDEAAAVAAAAKAVEGTGVAGGAAAAQTPGGSRARAGWRRAGALLRWLSEDGARRQASASRHLAAAAVIPAAADKGPGATAHLHLLGGPHHGKPSPQQRISASCPADTARRSGNAPPTIRAKAPGQSRVSDQASAAHAPPHPKRNVDARNAHSQQLSRQPTAGFSPFRQGAYSNAMRTARRTLVEFALEQGCAATVTALLTACPVPSPAGPPAEAAAEPPVTCVGNANDGGGGGAASAGCELAQLAEASHAASPDGLTLLHRAVRSGDAATVHALLHAATPAPATTPFSTAVTRTIYCSASEHMQQCLPATCARTVTAPRRGLCAWDSADAYGLTPLHYMAVLPDGGHLARAVLRSEPEALALWDAEAVAGVPSPACFAAQSGMVVNVGALRREVEREAERERHSGCEQQRERQRQGEQAQASRGEPGRGGGSEKAERKLGFDMLQQPSSSVQSACTSCGSCKRVTPTWSSSVWLLLGHLTACALGLLQVLLHRHARCRFSLLPLALHVGSVLLALACGPVSNTAPTAAGCGTTALRPRRRLSWDGAASGAAWAMQLLALAALVAQTTGLPRGWPLGAAGRALGDAAANNPGDSGVCGGGSGGGALYNSHIVLQYLLAVSMVPFSSTLHKLLIVQAVEALACLPVLLLSSCAGGGVWAAASGVCSDDGGVGGGAMATALSSGVGWWCAEAALARGAVVQFARGWVLRVAASSMLILAVDMRCRAVCGRACCTGRAKAQ